MIEDVTVVEDDENSRLKTELKLLKSNFERLELMYHEALDEVNTVRSEYEAKIVTAHDEFRTVKAENEVLKEKVDVLFKLGRSYLNNNNKKQEKSSENSVTTNEDIVVIDEVVEEAGELENLQAWTQNKMRGFRRVDPTKPSIHKNVSSTESNFIPRQRPSTRAPNGTSSTPSSLPPSSSGTGDDAYRGKYCHYFVNEGKCRYEERTGNKCKFEHKQAPMCNFGTSCSRSKCMFSHPKIPGSQNNHSFLGQVISPWNLPNPWTNQVSTPWNFPSPWTMKMPANFNQQ